MVLTRTLYLWGCMHLALIRQFMVFAAVIADGGLVVVVHYFGYVGAGMGYGTVGCERWHCCYQGGCLAVQLCSRSLLSSTLLRLTDVGVAIVDVVVDYSVPVHSVWWRCRCS